MAKSGGHASCMGTTIGGYEVLSHIGRGAMGVVYLARDVKLNRRAALKVLLGSLARNPAAIKRFHLEAQAAAPLRHPNIVRIYAAGVDDGIPYIAMEYVEGEPLDRFLRRKGPIKWQNALYIAQQVAEALDCAHRSGVIHRDIKPANIMLDRQGRVRLTDFGIAHVKQPGGTLPEDTGSFATPQYMAPEQCRGHALYPTSDLFALGVTLYHMLTGEMPFHGESAPALIKSITNDEPPRVNRLVPDIPDDVARLVAHLLAKQPEERPESAQAVCERIADVQLHKGGTSAMPEALTSFIKEQAQPRTVEHDQPTPKPKRRSGAVRLEEAARRVPNRFVRTAGAGAALLVVLTVVAAFSSYSFATRGAAWPGPAPQLDAVRFKRQFDPPVLTASLNGDAFAWDEIAWVGAEPVLLARAGGRQGALTQGLHGVVAMEPAALRASALISPRGGGGAAPDASLRAASLVVPVTPPESPFHHALILEHQDGSNSIVAVAQKWNEAGPRPQVLGQIAVPAEAHAIERLWRPAGAVPAVPSPDGYTVCLVKRERTGGEYLIQRDVRRQPLDALGERLTGAGTPFVPNSIRYSHDGQDLVYIREKAGAERELWAVQPAAGRMDGVPLMVGPIGDAAAFDPAGRRVAISRYRADGDADIYLLRISSNPEAVNIGAGLVCAESWAPSGGFLVVAARPEVVEEDISQGPAAPYQLYAVQTAPPYTRTRLTNVPGGVRPVVAVSRDGAWAAAVADVAVPATLVFVSLGDARPAAAGGR